MLVVCVRKIWVRRVEEGEMGWSLAVHLQTLCVLYQGHVPVEWQVGGVHHA